jgi:hypothetical protein
VLGVTDLLGNPSQWQVGSLQVAECHVTAYFILDGFEAFALCVEPAE